MDLKEASQITNCEYYETEGGKEEWEEKRKHRRLKREMQTREGEQFHSKRNIITRQVWSSIITPNNDLKREARRQKKSVLQLDEGNDGSLRKYDGDCLWKQLRSRQERGVVQCLYCARIGRGNGKMSWKGDISGRKPEIHEARSPKTTTPFVGNELLMV
jgi:hypothetical protein